MNVISKRIGLDMGHRVTHHGSKCRNPHGHRYEVEAVCMGELCSRGESEGMVLDFGFLKEAMMELIHGPCDHGFCIWCNDAQMVEMFEPNVDPDIPWTEAQACTNKHGMKLYVVPFVPTAENLAKHWFDLLAPKVELLTANRATLKTIRVWETPTSVAEYTA